MEEKKNETVQKEPEVQLEEKEVQPEEKGRKKEEERKYSDADLDEIINKKFAKWQSEKQKEIDEAKRLADMNAQEKAEYERDQMRQELERLKTAQTIHEMTKTARKMLSEKGLSVPDGILTILVDKDAEKTKKAVDDFSEMYKDAVELGVKERLKSPSPRTGAAPTMTKEQIMAIQDKDARLQAIRENIKLFEN